MKAASILIKVGIVILVVAIVLRLRGFADHNPIPLIGTTPGALHRFVDTLFLLSIAMLLLEIGSYLKRMLPQAKGGSSESSSE